jgi:hypothetical protein
MPSVKSNDRPLFPGPWWAVRAWRNPLMPTGYRIRHLLRLSLAIAAVAAIPVAVLLGVGHYHRTVTVADRDRAALHHVDAVADTDSSLVGPEMLVAWAHWTYAGVTHTGSLPVRSATHDEDRIPILVTDAGDRAAPPPTHAENLGDAVLFAIFVYGGGLLATIALLWTTDRVIDHRRYRRWGHEWQSLATDRRWNHR